MQLSHIIDQTIEDDNGCFVWQKARNGKGYSQIHVKDRGLISGHRLVWELVYGKIPMGMQVLHSCFNKLCINVDHLRLGTHQENQQDQDKAKLSVEKIQQIRDMANSWKFSQREIAEKFGISQGMVSQLRTGKRWDNIDYDESDLIFNKTERVAYKLTADDVREIRKLVSKGLRQYEVAKMFNIHPSNVSRIVNKKRRQAIEEIA